MELVVRLICFSYLFFVMKFDEKKAIVSVQKSFNTQRTKRKVKVFMKGV